MNLSKVLRLNQLCVPLTVYLGAVFTMLGMLVVSVQHFRSGVLFGPDISFPL